MAWPHGDPSVPSLSKSASAMTSPSLGGLVWGLLSIRLSSCPGELENDEPWENTMVELRRPVFLFILALLASFLLEVVVGFVGSESSFNC